MPCLNEARTLAACIEQAHAGCQSALAQRTHSPGNASDAGSTGRDATHSDAAPGKAPGLTYEILIADNGSTDGSQEIAIANDARVVHVEKKGYGAALLGGIAAARGKYVVMGDSDCSYDFGEVPRFLDKLEEGYDLVMGNRFAGGIMPGAMPWHHRYIGNPILSGLGRLLYPTPCRDWHCGLRAFDREKIQALNLKAPGMEFASEMVINASQGKLRMGEIPIQLRPDGRLGPPHLRSFRDGVRHLNQLLRLNGANTIHISASKENRALIPRGRK
jgi:glycosyltransferase involved in cell wall biosynthesis